MDPSTKPGRRSKAQTSTSDHLDRLRANRAQLDLDKRDRERREDAALTAFAEATGFVERLEQERDDKLADLERQAQEVRDQTRERVEHVHDGQREALRELHDVGRSAEDIAMLLELPKDRVRRLLRAERSEATDRRRTSGRANTQPPSAAGVSRQPESTAELSHPPNATKLGGSATGGPGSAESPVGDRSRGNGE
ncbi:MAG: hypothetical protein ACRDRL_27240 [Sciscionella sp.]